MSAPPAPDVGARLLPACAARTLYNVADALVPPGDDGERGGGDVDFVAAAESLLAREPAGAARRLRAALAWLEWEPRLTRRGRHGFSWLPRAERRRWIEAWERSALAPKRHAARRVRALVWASLEVCGLSPCAASSTRSRPGSSA